MEMHRDLWKAGIALMRRLFGARPVGALIKAVSASIAFLLLWLLVPKVLALVLVLSVVAAVLWAGILLWKDIRLFVRIKRAKELTAMQAVHAWASCRFVTSRVMMIMYVAQRDLLVASEESRGLVRGLPLLLERDILLPADEPNIEPCGFTDIDDWYQGYVATHNDRLRRWGIGALDELCRLEQKLSQSRREPTAGKALSNG
jgi:hypothetical protein